MKWSAPPAHMKEPVHFFAFGFGAGLSPYAPGTIGTLVGVPLAWFMLKLTWPLQLAAVLVAFVFGIYVCGRSASRLGVHDHGGIVWDEITGFAITMFASPPKWQWFVTGFVLFRLLDIIKPWPIREADHRLSGGLGIMLDDVMAGAFACVILVVLRSVF